jgi:arginine exporter protein ArgO
MLKLLIKIVSVIALIVFGIFVFIKALPWLLGIVAVVGVIIELYYLWLRSRNGGGSAQLG